MPLGIDLWVDFGYQNVSKLAPKWDQKSMLTSKGVQNCALGGLGANLGANMGANLGANLDFNLRRDPLLGAKLASQTEPKSIKNRCKNRSKNRCLLKSIFERILLDFWEENGGKLAPKSIKNR